MNIKKLFNRKFDENEFDADSVETKEPTYMDDAQTAAVIVNTVVQAGNISVLPEKLETLSNKYNNEEQYVFEYKNIIFYYLLTALSAVFSIRFLYFIILGLGTLFLSSEFRGSAVIQVLFSILILVFNAFVIKKSVEEIQFKKRYNSYFKVLKYKNIEMLSDLALYSNTTESVLIEDLAKAVKNKLIPQGHFGRDNIIFMMNDFTFEKYNEKPAVYDRYYMQLLEERERVNERSEEIKEILDTGKMYVGKIHDSNDIIKDKLISRKLDAMENIVSTIFHEVDINPSQADKLGLFLSYYLPTTDKLLQSYIDISEKNSNVKSLEKAKKDIENALDKLNAAFEGILGKFYREQELDISSDISAMEIMMKQEGLID